MIYLSKDYFLFKKGSLMKKLISSLILLSTIAFTGCSQENQNLSYLNDINGQTQELSAYAKPKAKIKTDWYESLSPELQKYYAPAKGKLGVALFESLHQIIAQNQKSSDYLVAKSFMYEKADNLNNNGKTGLFDVYSYIFVPGSGGNGNLYKEAGDENKDGHPSDFINCEHTWPQSFFKKELPMVSDLHHMFPSMSVPNAMRSNNAFGMANSDNRMVIYTTDAVSGSKLGVIDPKHRSLEELKRLINLPYEQRPELEKELDEVFEPGDKQKGNTARAMLYFYLRYYDKNIRQGDFDDKQFWDSKVPMFINWSETVDPVDQAEVKRHQFVYENQKNRNPFIDIPNLASLIGPEVFQNK